MTTATSLINARGLLRDALHQRVRGVDDWAQPSISVFRNRLLDDVGSDARPLTNLLLEAVDRGVLHSLPRDRMAPAQWTARCTSLVMQWVAERFVQPEAARWAVESWAYALGTIEASQITAFADAPATHGAWSSSARASSGDVSPRAGAALPPSARATPSRGRAAAPPTTSTAWRAPAGTPSAGSFANSHANASANTSANSSATNTSAHTSAHTSANAYATGRGGRAVPYARPVPRPVSVTSPPTRGSGLWPAPLDNLVGRTSVVVLAVMLVVIGVQIARAPSAALSATLPDAPTVTAGDAGDAGDALDATQIDSLSIVSAMELIETPSVISTTTSQRAQGAGSDGANGAVFQGATGLPSAAVIGGIGVGGEPTRVSLSPGSGNAPSLAMTRLPAEGATPGAYRELTERSNLRALRGGDPGKVTSTSTATNAPGVPGITRSAMPLNDADMSRVRRVAPATRPAPRATASTPAVGGAPAAGASGRAAPGLDQLRLESGRRLQGRVEIIRASSVVFRDAETGLRYEFPKNDIDEIITEFGNAVRFRERGGAAPGSAGDRRTKSVAGRYVVRYEAARVNGSAACADLWRGPTGTDVAVVRHRAGDDTLSVAFEGGDSFPSVLDADGFFNSTFRIMPGQAELATALTTRISGWISPEQTLALQVNVIGYRRVQGTTGVSCHIIVDATGTRTP